VHVQVYAPASIWGYSTTEFGWNTKSHYRMGEAWKL
jgi:hypothetical protein